MKLVLMTPHFLFTDGLLSGFMESQMRNPIIPTPQTALAALQRKRKSPSSAPVEMPREMKVSPQLVPNKSTFIRPGHPSNVAYNLLSDYRTYPGLQRSS